MIISKRQEEVIKHACKSVCSVIGSGVILEKDVLPIMQIALNHIARVKQGIPIFLSSLQMPLVADAAVVRDTQLFMQVCKEFIDKSRSELFQYNKLIEEIEKEIVEHDGKMMTALRMPKTYQYFYKMYKHLEMGGT